MTKTGWIIEEVNGLWWIYTGQRPEDSAFDKSHGTMPNNLFGPYFSKYYAEYAIAENKVGKISKGGRY